MSSDLTKPRHPADRWLTVLSGALGCAAGAGVISSYVFGLFIKAISAEYGWDRSLTTVSILCFYIGCGVGCLSLGHIMARWGVKRATIVFVILFSASVALVGMLPGSVLLFSLTFLAMGFFGAAATAMPYAVAISAWFDKGRGVALALAVSGTGLSATFMSSYATWLMERYGWRGGYFGVGLFCAVVALFGLVFLFRTPPNARSPEPESGLGDWRQLLTPRYLKIAVPVFLISIALMGAITNLAPIFTDRGMSMTDAARLLGLMGLASWVSRLAVGFFLDHLHVRLVSALIFLLVAIGCAVLLWGGPPEIAAIAIGLGIGSEADLIAYAVSRYFSRRQISLALGAVFIFWAWGGGLGVVLGSLSFDLTGSYDAALIGYAIMSLISAGMIFTLGPYSEIEAQRQ